MSERRLFLANGYQLGDYRSFGRSLCFKLKKLLGYKREQKCSSQSSDYGCWQEPPEEILETILQHLRLSDRIRLSIVCKSWRSVVMSSSTHEFPWLVLPQSSDCSKNKTLSFYSLSDGKVVDLKLPKPVQGGWFCGSSKGWLIMIKERGLNSQVFLLNPISGALHQLPSLATIPSFLKFVETEHWKLYGASLFFNQVALSTSNIYSDQCVVAALSDSCKELALCRPGSKTWSVFCDFDHEHTRYSLSQLLFSSGKLYALFHTKNIIQKDMIVARTLRFGDYVLELMIVYDSIIEPLGEIEEYHDHKVYLQYGYSRFLFESTNNEVLLIHKIDDILMAKKNDDNDVEEDGEDEQGNDDDDDEEDEQGNDDDDDDDDDMEEDGGHGNDDNDVEGNDDEDDDMEEDEGNDDNDEEDDDDDNENWDMYGRTSSFRVYKIDSQTKTSNFLPVPSLGDQILFLAYGGNLSLSALDLKESEKNCIYFATKSTCNDVIPNPLTSREIGVFYLDSGKIIKSFPSFNFSTRSRTSWYVPSLR